LRETQKLQEEKTNAERLATLGKLAHTVGHEIKHDIAVAVNYIDVLAYDVRGDRELSRIYHQVMASLTEAIDKFQNMLLIGRPRPPEKEVIVAADIFRLAESMQRRGESSDVELIVRGPDHAEHLEADIKQIRVVLSNLFDNSLDAIKSRRDNTGRTDRGRIECLGTAENGDLKIEWTDNGCGIPKDQIEKVFTAFVTSKATGNGLGLFIVKNIIENHGGRVMVESKEGTRTTFTITLPLLQEKDNLTDPEEEDTQ
jgi:signal transduction histidine kinase